MTRPLYYRLNDDGSTEASIDFALQSIDERRIDRTQVGDYEVSTVFLGVDHNPFSGPPVLFETLVFGGVEWCHVEFRYSTIEAARAGHARVVAALAAGEDPSTLDVAP